MSTLKYAEYMTASKHSPVPTWLFNVSFRCNNNLYLETKLNELECLTCGLPENETQITEVYFFGSMKTVPVKRKYDGEVSMTFFDRNSNDDGMIQLAANFLVTAKKENADINDKFSTRKEFGINLDKVQIDVFDASSKNKYRTFYLYNPVITKFAYASELDVSSEEALKYNITVHYDYWDFE